MKLFGIPLRKPTFNEVTVAAVMATGLFLAALGVMRLFRLPIDPIEAGALLLVVVWGCVSVRMGIRIDQGRNHMAASLMVSALLLGAYKGAWAFVA
jgi:hypothetical protein